MTRPSHSSLRFLLLLLPFAITLSTHSQVLSGRQFKLSHKLDAALATGPPANRLVYNPLARLATGNALSPADATVLHPESAVLDQFQADGTVLVGCNDPRLVFSPASRAWPLVRSPAFLLGASKAYDLALLSRHETAAAATTSNPPSISFTFVGTGLDLFGSRSPQHGQARVRLDGREVATVDAFGKFKPRQKLWSVRDLQHGMHTVQFEPLGTKQRRSGGVVVDVEGFAVIGLGGGGKQRVGSFAAQGSRSGAASGGEGQDEWEVTEY